MPVGYTLTIRSKWPLASGREIGVYGRMTLARVPSAFSEPMAALTSRHEATVMPDVASGSANAKL